MGKRSFAPSPSHTSGICYYQDFIIRIINQYRILWVRGEASLPLTHIKSYWLIITYNFMEGKREGARATTPNRTQQLSSCRRTGCLGAKAEGELRPQAPSSPTATLFRLEESNVWGRSFAAPKHSFLQYETRYFTGT